MVFRDIRIDPNKTKGAFGGIKPTANKDNYSFQPNDVYPTGTVGSSTGIYTTGGKKAGVSTDTGEKVVNVGGRTYTYRNGKLVNVSQGYQDVNARNEFAAAQQAAADFAAQNEDTTGANLGTGSGVPKAVQMATNALVARLRGGGYGQAYQPAIDTLQGLLEGDKASLASQEYLAPVTALQNQLGNIYGQAQTAMTGANTALMDYLSKNMVNPFQNVKAETGVVDPSLAALLQEQGVAGEPLAAQVTAAREAAQAGGGQFQNLVNVLSGLQQAGLGSLQSEAALQQQYANQLLESQKAAYNQQLLGQGEALRQALQEQIRKGATDVSGLLGQQASAKETLQGQLLDLIAKGGTVPKGVLGKVFGSDVTSKSKSSKKKK